jgi:hypothetical protein
MVDKFGVERREHVSVPVPPHGYAVGVEHHRVGGKSEKIAIRLLGLTGHRSGISGKIAGEAPNEVRGGTVGDLKPLTGDEREIHVNRVWE